MIAREYLEWGSATSSQLRSEHVKRLVALGGSRSVSVWRERSESVTVVQSVVPIDSCDIYR